MEGEKKTTKSDCLKQESKKARQKTQKQQKNVEEVCGILPQLHPDMDDSLEGKVMKLVEVIQDMQVKVNKGQLETPSNIQTK